MPTLEDALISDLANAGLSFAARVYFEKAPERPTEPYVVLQFIAADPLHTQLGPPTLRRDLIQFSAFHEKQRSSKAAIEEIRARYDGHQGIVAGLDIRAMLLEAQRGPIYEDDTKLHNSQVDLMVHYLPS